MPAAATFSGRAMKFFRTSEMQTVPQVVKVDDFLAALTLIAPRAGGGHYSFMRPDGTCRGFVQFIIESAQRIKIHRIWSLEPGRGNGSYMLGRLCELADEHDIELELKVIPIGRKPYPLSREQLMAWYARHGFVGTRRRMCRMSKAALPV